MHSLTAADWLEVLEQGALCTPALRPCVLLAPLLAAGMDDALALPLGERDRQLLGLHQALFGEQLQLVADCPVCQQVLELTLSCGDLLLAAEPSALAADDLCPFPLRLPTTIDLLAIGPEATCDLPSQRLRLLARCLSAEVKATEYEPALAWLQQQPSTVLEQLNSRLAEADPQAVMELALSCPACLHQWPELLDIGGYVWDALTIWGQSTLDQVHLLAKAYGWSQAEILALSPARRGQYLQRVLA